MIWAMAATAAAAIAHLWLLVPRLPPPATEPGEVPPDYRSLASRTGLVVVALAAGASWLLVAPAPAEAPAWFGYLGGGSVLAWVDLRTTYLPRRLHYIVLAQVAAGLAWLAVTHWMVAAAALAGGLAAAGLLWLVWRRGGSLGFGDVRLGLLTGAMGATMGLAGWIWSLMAGSLVGLVLAVTHTLRRRHTSLPTYFAYGPALWLGPVITAVVSGW
ncbi:MAG: leader peptidase (prepilin peptidase)/N-methyltransferase [Arachnia sp.]